jgi:hypothetical protein
MAGRVRSWLWLLMPTVVGGALTVVAVVGDRVWSWQPIWSELLLTYGAASALVSAIFLIERRLARAVEDLDQFLTGWSAEERIRARLRRSHALRPLATDEVDSPPGALPSGVFGFEEIFASKGLLGGQARLKADGSRYPMEVHKFLGEVYVVGFVSDSDLRSLNSDRRGEITLWMRRQRDARALVEVPTSRVADERSLGDGSALNGFRLGLTLGPATDRSNAPSET